MADVRETDSIAEISRPRMRLHCFSEVEVDPDCDGGRSKSKRERESGGTRERWSSNERGVSVTRG